MKDIKEIARRFLRYGLPTGDVIVPVAVCSAIATLLVGVMWYFHGFHGVLAFLAITLFPMIVLVAFIAIGVALREWSDK